MEQFSQELRRGRTVADHFRRLKARGFAPDLIIAHPAWGEALFVRDVFPKAKLLAYLEYFYRSPDSDIDFDPEFPPPAYDLPYVRFRNIPTLMAFESADLCITPSTWQASTFPPPIRKQLTILHDGIDTKKAKPNPSARLTLQDGRVITRSDDVITYVARSLEPYRGFHVLMLALPDVLRRRPKATVVIVGGDDVSYGRAAGPGITWRERLLDEVGKDIDLSRVAFLGRIPYDGYLSLLQVSRVHVYLTYPFVLSWSLLEAMAAGCAVVASDTGPVTEVLTDGENGRLTGFFDRTRLCEIIDELLDDPDQRERLGKNARASVVDRCDFKTKIFPRYKQILDDLVASR